MQLFISPYIKTDGSVLLWIPRKQSKTEASHFIISSQGLICGTQGISLALMKGKWHGFGNCVTWQLYMINNPWVIFAVNSEVLRLCVGDVNSVYSTHVNTKSHCLCSLLFSKSDYQKTSQGFCFYRAKMICICLRITAITTILTIKMVIHSDTCRAFYIFRKCALCILSNSVLVPV